MKELFIQFIILPSLLIQGQQNTFCEEAPVGAGGSLQQDYLYFVCFRSFCRYCALRLRLARLIAPGPTAASSAGTPSPPKTRRSCRDTTASVPRITTPSPNTKIFRKKLFNHL